jgi:hypothetical protein
MFRIPHFIHNRLRDGGEVVRITRLQRSTPQKHFFFLLLVLISERLSKTQGQVRLEELGKLKKSMTSPGLETATFRLVVSFLN